MLMLQGVKEWKYQDNETKIKEKMKTNSSCNCNIDNTPAWANWSTSIAELEKLSIVMEIDVNCWKYHEI